MRVCIITCSNADNHGARLQTFALAKYLTEHGNEVRVIDYRPSYLDPSYKVLYWPGLSVKEWAKLLLRFAQRVRSKKRHNSFTAFSKKYIPLTYRIYRSVDELRNDPPEADLYMAGSDQIWNTSFPNATDPAFFLDFGSDGIRRESFAASFATDILRPGSEAFVSVNLARFDRITVRERSGIDIVESLGYKAELQDDPVFLLSAEQWDHIADGTGEGKRYVLVYDFFSDKEIKRKARETAKERNLSIYAVCPFRQPYADKNYVTAGPESFVSLVKNASLVVTNSYHAIAFSIIYNRPFAFVPRPDGLNDRIYDLLSRR